MTFGERLKELREAAGLSQSALAIAAGVGLPTIKDYEGNRRSPSLENAQSIARSLGVTCRAFDGCEFLHATQRPAPTTDAAERTTSRRAAGKGKATKKHRGTGK